MAPWKSVDEIVPGLFLGNLQIATESTRYLTEHRITHIISVCHNEVPAQAPGSRFQHMRIAVHDADHENLLHYMRDACDFISGALAMGGHVLVHSVEGRSRATTIVAAYLMFKENIGSGEALARIREIREQVWINRGFQEQLTIFQIDGHAPHPLSGAYLGWRIKMATHLATMQANAALQ